MLMLFVLFGGFVHMANAHITSVTIAPSNPTIDNGQSILLTTTNTFTIQIDTPYNYQWYSNSGCTTSINGATSNTYLASPVTTTTYCVKVTDKTNTEVTDTDSVTVHSALVAGTPTISNAIIDAGQTDTFTSVPSGGTTSYSYQWYSGVSATCTSDAAITGAASAAYSTQPVSGNYFCYKLTDSASTPNVIYSATVQPTVHSSLVAGTPTISNAIIDAGQTDTFTSVPSGGTTSYSYQWYSGVSATCTSDAAITGAASAAYSTQPVSGNYFCYKLTDSASTPNVIYSATVQPTVHSSLVAGTPTISNAIIDAGQTDTFTSVPSGGTTSYSYQWYSGVSATCTSDAAITGAASAAYSTQPVSGNYFCYKLTDSASTPNVIYSATVQPTVHSSLVAGTPTISNAIIDAGQTDTFTSVPSGGTTSYSYQWYSGVSATCTSDAAITGAASAAYSTQPVSGNYFCYKLTDSASTPNVIYSATVQPTVHSSLVAGTPTISNAIIDAGQTDTFTSVPSGGTTSYSYQWYSGVSATCTSDAAITGATSAAYSTQPVSGNYFCYKLTDSASTPNVIYSATIRPTVYTTPTVTTPSPSSVTLISGQTETFSTTILGGTGSFTVNLVNTTSDTTVQELTGQTDGPVTFTGFPIIANGTHTYNVVATDTGTTPQFAFNSPRNTVTVILPLTVSLTESNSTIDAGQIETLTATSTGGISPYIFTFYFANPGSNHTISGCGNLNTGTNTATCTFTESPAIGAQPYGAGVTSGSQSVNSTALIVDSEPVGSTPPSLTIQASNPSLPIDQTSETLTAVKSGGIGPSFTYTFYNVTGGSASAIPGCSSILTNTCTFDVINQAGIYSFNATVTDNAIQPFTFGSTKTTIEVNALVAGAPTPTNPTIDLGQNVILTANPTGGSGLYNDYQWYSSTSSAVPRPWNTSTSSGQGTILDGMNSSTWSAGGGTVTVNAQNYVEGDGSIELTVPPSTPFSNIAKTETPSLDLSKASNFYFWVYVPNTLDLSAPGTFGVTLDLYSSTTAPISYFQCGIQTGALQDGWNPVVVAQSACTPNANSPSWGSISLIQFIVATNSSLNHKAAFDFGPLKENYAGGAFNKAQVVLTFDGAWNSTLINATPIMQTITLAHPFSQTGVAFIVTNEINAAGGDGCGVGKCINLSQLASLYGNGWDLASHTMNHANLVTETADNFPSGINNNYELSASQSILVNNGFTRAADIFAYPNGAYNSVVINQVKNNNYILARTLGFGITQPNLYPDDPYNLSYRVQSLVMAPGPTTTPAVVESEINNVIAENGLLVLTFHIIQPNTATAVEYSTANFTILSNYLSTAQSEGLLQVTNFSSYYAILNGTVIDPFPRSVTTGSTLNIAPTSTTSKTYYYYRVASGPFVAYSPTAGVTVNIAPTVTTPAPSNVTLDAGQGETFSATITGGTGPFTVNLVNASNGNTIQSLAGQPAGPVTFTGFQILAAGPHAYNVVITDTGTATPYIFNSTKSSVTVSTAPAVSITASNATIDVGQVETLSANVTAGTGPFTYAFWNTTAGTAISACAGTYTGPSVSCIGLTPTSSTSYNVVITDIGTATPYIFNSTKAAITVDAIPTVTAPSPSNSTLDSGQGETFTTTITGGTDAFTVDLVNVSTGAMVQQLTGQSDGTVTFTGFPIIAVGAHTYNVVVTDATSTPYIFNSTKSSVTVSTAPAVSITASNATIDVGQVETLSANVTAGTGSFTYAFWNTTAGTAISACAGTYTGPSVSCIGLTPTSSTSYNVVITDTGTATPYIFNSTKASVTVSTAPAVSITASNATIDVGQVETLSANVTAGTGPFTYAFWNTTAGTAISACAGTYTGPSVSCIGLTPTSSTSYNVVITDIGTATPYIFNSTKAAITVDAIPTVTAPSPSNSTLDSGQGETFTTTITGGTDAFTVDLVNVSTGAMVQQLTGQSDGTVTFTGFPIIAVGAHTYNVVVTDATSTPYIFNSTKSSVTVSTAPAVSITASNATIDVGQVETLSANVTAGTGSFTYAFWNTTAGTAISACAGTYTGPSVSCIGLTPTSSTSYNVVITDTGTATPYIFNSTKASVTVSTAPAVSITASNATIDVGQVETLSANVTAGTGPFTYAFWNTTAGTAISACAGTYTGPSVSCIGLTPTSSTSYNVVITDIGTATPYIFNSTKAAITVDAIPTVTAPSPSNSTLDSGQGETFTTTITGGTDAFTVDLVNVSTGAMVQQLTGQSDGTVTFTGFPIIAVGAHTYNVVVTDATSTPYIFNSTKSSVTVSTAPAVSITASNATIDVGQVETLSANVTAGTGSFTYAFWNTTAGTAISACAGTYTGPSVSCIGLTPTSSTSYNVVITDTGTATPYIFNSTKVLVTAGATPTVSIPTTPIVADVGQTLSSLTAKVTYTGPSTTSVEWYSSSTSSCDSASTDTGISGTLFTPSAISTGTTYYCAVVSDSNIVGYTSQSGSVEVTIDTVPSIEQSPSSATIDAGQTDPLTSIVTGGSGQYSWQWYNGVGSIPGASGSGTTATYTASTADSYYAIFTDTGTAATPYLTAQSSSASITVNPDPQVSIAPLTPTVDEGQTQEFTATPSDGTGAYSYSWNTGGFIQASGCTAPDITCTINTIGFESVTPFTVSVQVTDAQGVQSSTAQASITVNPPIIVGVTPSSPTIDAGQTATLTANPIQGSGIFASYAWYQDTCGVGPILGSSASFTTPTLSSGATYCVIVTDSLGTSAQGTDTVNVNSGASALAVAILPSNPSITSGTFEPLTASPSGGSGTYSAYAWYQGSTCAGSVIATTSNYTTPVLTATTEYCVQVTDSIGGAAQGTDTVLVNAAPVPLSVTVTGTTAATVGQTITLTANPVGGTGSYTYQWFNDSTGTPSLITTGQVPSATSQSFTETAGAIGPAAYYVAVADLGTNTTKSTPDSQVIVSATPVPLSVTVTGTTAATVGQTITLTANPVGGTGSYTYQWFNDSTGTPSLITTGQVPSATSQSFTETAGAIGPAAYYVAVADLGTNTTKSTPDSQVIVSATPVPLSVTVTGTTAATVGQTITLTANPVGGTGSYTYQWFNDSTGTPSLITTGQVPSATSQSFTETAGAIGPAAYYVAVADLGTNTIKSTPDSQVIVSAVVVTDQSVPIHVLPSTTALAGQSLTVSADLTGLTFGPGIAFAWGTVGSCPDFAFADPGSVQQFTYASTPSGITTNCQFTVSFIDTAGDTGAGTSATVTINPSASTPLGISALTPSEISGNVGDIVTLTGTITGGTSPYTATVLSGSIEGSLDPSACGVSSSTVTCTVTLPTVITSTDDTYSVTVQDATSTTTSGTGTVNVNPSTTTSTTTSSTTTVGGGGSGGTGGGGGGGGGGGSSVPLVTYANSCAIITNVTVPNSFSFHAGGQSFTNAVDNFIASNFTSVIVNGTTYIITLNGSAPIGPGVSMRLTNVSYAPIEHTVSFSVCGSASNSTISNSTTLINNVTVDATFNGTILTITNVTPANLTGRVTLSNVTDVPTLPPGFVGIFVSNLSINSANVSSVSFKVNYNCSINATTLQPYMYKNGTWRPINPFSVNSGTCTVTFNVPKDPIIALLVHSVTPPTQIRPNNSTTTSAIVQNTTTVAQPTTTKASNTNLWKDLAAVIIVLVIVIVAATAMTMRGSRKKGKRGSVSSLWSRRGKASKPGKFG